MVKLFDRLFLFLSRHRMAVALLLWAFSVVCILAALSTKYEEDISKFLPSNDRNEKYQSVYQKINDQHQVAVIFGSRDTTVVMPADSLEEAMDFFAEALSDADTAGVVGDIQVRVDEDRAFDMMDFVYHNYPYFLDSADYKRIDSLVSTPGFVRQQIENDKRQMMLPTSIGKEVMTSDPLHLFSSVLQKMQTFRMESELEIVNGCIYTKDMRHSIAYFTSPYGIVDSKENAYIAAIVDSAVAKTQEEYPSVSVSAVSAGLIAVTNASQIKQDSMLAVAVAVVLILLLLLLHYRRLSDLWWIGASIVFGGLFAILGMWVFRDSVSIIVLGIGSVIIGICVNYPLHYLDHLKEVGDERRALREMVPPLLIGNITTVSAFLCLVWLDAQAMRDLGVFGSLMLVGTIMFVLVFLPLFVKARKTEKKSLDINVDFLKLDGKKSIRCFVAVVTIITIVLGYYSLNTSFDSNLQNINYMTDEQREDLRLLSSSVDSKIIYAVAEGNDMESALENNARMLDRIGSTDSSLSVRGAGTFIPTRSQQEQRLALWKSFVSDKAKINKLLAELRSEGARQGFSADAFQPFEELLGGDFDVQKMDYFSPITDVLSQGYIVKDEGKVDIVSYITSENDDIKQAVNAIDDGGSIFAFDSKDISNQLVEILNDSFNYIGFVCGFVVFFFLWLSFGRIELSLMSFLPLAVSWIWILGIMELLGIKFNIVNIILATFIFGQGDDYTIFITEGLISEYATGRKQLTSYKRSVALSAVIMFIGIGTLIFAKHPALKSLAEVTIIGMFTVVFMAYYLPPIVFRWITTKKGMIRHIPLTLSRLCYSLFAFVCFLIVMMGYFQPYTWLYFLFHKDNEENRRKYHEKLCRMCKFTIGSVPGVRLSVDNPSGETFEKQAIVICNHQSHLDLMCLMMLTPKVVFLTNKWAWNNPLYASIIHKAEFLPVSDGIEENMHKIEALYKRGYSIALFPEGTRSLDFNILRFHKGAFYLAEQLGADIIPVFLHGAGHVLPKRDFMLNRGAIHVEIGQRVAAGDTSWGETARSRTSSFHRYYKRHYDELCRKIEDSHYCAWYLRHQYIYKGVDIERRCNRELRDNNDYSDIIDDAGYLEQTIKDSETGRSTRIFDDCGIGVLPYLYALVHKDVMVTGVVQDDDDFAIASSMANLPSNIRFVRSERQAEETGG